MNRHHIMLMTAMLLLAGLAHGAGAPAPGRGLDRLDLDPAVRAEVEEILNAARARREALFNEGRGEREARHAEACALKRDTDAKLRAVLGDQGFAEFERNRPHPRHERAGAPDGQRPAHARGPGGEGRGHGDQRPRHAPPRCDDDQAAHS